MSSFMALFFLLGMVVGVFVTCVLSAIGDEQQEQQFRRARELLRRAEWALSTHGERHLASAIRRELSEEAGA